MVLPVCSLILTISLGVVIGIYIRTEARRKFCPICECREYCSIGSSVEESSTEPKIPIACMNYSIKGHE